MTHNGVLVLTLYQLKKGLQWRNGRTNLPIMDAAAVRTFHDRFVASNDNVEPKPTRNVTELSYKP